MKMKLRHFKKTVTTAGTREQLTTIATKTPYVVIEGLKANTNSIFIGDNTVSSTTFFVSLGAGGTSELNLIPLGQAGAYIDLSTIWIDVTTSAEGVTVGFLDRVDND